MDNLLAIVTVLALSMAVAMTAVAVKLWRAERRRSEARMAALAQLSEDPAEAPMVPTTARPKESRVRDLPLRPDPLAATDVPAHDLFSEHAEASPWPRRFLAAGVVAALGLVLGSAAMLGGRGADQPQPPQTAAAPAPLELVSLRHEQAAPGLVVTGLVQNPSSATPAARVTATVFAFAQDGTFIASGRAPIEFTTLQPGDQSPFVVTVATTAAVARYRVGFRAEDGRVLAHVDKRQPESLARR